MKLAYMYAAPDVTHSNVTAIQGDMFETLKYIAQNGYTGVEFLVADPAKIDQQKLREAIEASNLDVPAICTGEVYGQDGLSFADPNAAIRLTAIDRMKAAMELAASYGAMVNVGRLRGRFQENIERHQTLEWIDDALRVCATAYPEVQIVMEPVNHLYANCLMNTEEMMVFIERLDLPNLGIMLDAVHMLVEGEEPSISIDRAQSKFWHFHISDSERKPVGDGKYPIDTIMQAVKDSGFNQYVTVETFQGGDARRAVKTSYDHLKHHFSA